MRVRDYVIMAAFLTAMPLPAAAQNGPPQYNGPQYSGHVDANGMPADHSTPAEQAQTRALNEQIQYDNHVIDEKAAQARARYDAQAAAYETDMARYHSAMARDAAQRNEYRAARVRYDAARARYDSAHGPARRREWPRDGHWAALAHGARLLGESVAFIDGTVAGVVTNTALAANGDVLALELRLPGGAPVWIDSADVRQSLASKALLTRLDSRDLLAMARTGASQSP